MRTITTRRDEMQAQPNKVRLSTVAPGATFQDGDVTTARVAMVVNGMVSPTPGAIAVVFIDTGEVGQLPEGLEVTVRAFTAVPTT